MSTIPALLGIDGGGTSTTAWLADLEGNVLGRGRAGPSNAKAIGPAAAWEALRQAIDGAFSDAGLVASEVEAACFGLAGIDRPNDRRLVEGWSATSRWARRLVLVNDGELVLAAGTPEGLGVAIIAGTG
ncbi:MAG: N-acetylglucosamine kinase, partial [Isosphaeraceae bacterium]|nr:N-acetylglucosamine kinase [Isosphaeraceae bacterium]